MTARSVQSRKAKGEEQRGDGTKGESRELSMFEREKRTITVSREGE